MKTIGKILALALTGATLALGSGAVAQEKTWPKVRIANLGGSNMRQRMFEETKSQLTRFQKLSTYFGRALR